MFISLHLQITNNVKCLLIHLTDETIHSSTDETIHSSSYFKALKLKNLCMSENIYKISLVAFRGTHKEKNKLHIFNRKNI